MGISASFIGTAQNYYSHNSSDTLLYDATIKISTDTIPDTLYIGNCGLDIHFQSDMSHGNLYQDSLGKPRNSIISFCPPDNQSQLIFNFNHFDLEEGDTLYAFEGLTGSGSTITSGSTTFPSTSTLITKHSGNGASAYNGGWVSASCDQAINPTGCITFLFITDGDFRKSTGWDASFTCLDRTISLMPPDHIFADLDCAQTKKQVTIGAGKIVTGVDATDVANYYNSTDCTISNDSITIKIINAVGAVCKDTCLRAEESFTIDTLAIGTYTVEYALKANPTIKAKRHLAISPPPMICNDNINVSLGSGCGFSLAPDDILENPCDLNSPDMYYEMTVTLGSGYNQIKMTSSTPTTGSGSNALPNTPLLWIPRDSIKKAGLNHCGGIATVEVRRIYDYQNTCCSAGKVEDVCWGKVTFQDETPPVVYKLQKDTITACKTDLVYLEGLLGKPTVIDNCDSSNVHLVEIEIVSGTACDSISKYATTWKAEDYCGNQTILRDTLYIRRPTAKDIVKLPDVTLSCGVDEESAIFDLNVTGIPKFALTNDTLQLSPDYYTCDFVLIKRDEYVPHPGGTKLIRFWSLSDNCAPSPIPVPIDTQLVEFVDSLYPTLICPANGKLEYADKFPLNGFECTQSVSIDPPTAVDLCDPNPNVYTIGVEQLNHGKWDSIAPNLIAAGELTADTFRVGWVAKDASHHHAKDTCHSYFILEDLTPPSAICKDQLNVSFGNGDPIITPDDIDDISWDACGIANREIRITGDEYWGQQVIMTCENVYEPVRVELLVTDETGNNNSCWLFVNVLDNVLPFCNKLEDAVAYCDQFYTGDLGESTDLDGDGRMEHSEWLPLTDSLLALYDSHFGYPTCEDNAACRVLSVEQEYQLIYNQCGQADIRRRYRAIDQLQASQFSGWEEQTIAVTYRPGWKFTLPADWTGECGDDLPSAGVTIDRGACDVLAWEHEDQVFDIVQDACYQVNRTYYIINWCTYEAGMQPIEIRRDENAFGDANQELLINFSDYDNYGYYKYTQVLKINDYNKPVVTINPVPTCIYGEGNVPTIGNPVTNTGCDTIRVFSAEASDCEAAFFKNFAFEWWIYEDGVQTGQGDTEKFFWTVQPKIDYTVRFRVYDNCGNFGEKEEHFQFWDCTQPTIVCQDTIGTSIRENGAALVSPAIIAADSYDNCTPTAELDYRIWHSSHSGVPPDSIQHIQALPNALELDCSYLGPQLVRVYILDGEANYSSCTTNIVIEDSGTRCTNIDESIRGKIAGTIMMENGVEVEEVAVQLTNMDNAPAPYMTSTDGNYQFELNKGHTYNIQPRKNINPLNGVSTYDLVLISKHILSIEKITSPYHQIAADVNQSGQITAYDMVQLRQLILNITTEFPNNESWRFVDASYIFESEDALSESFNEVIEVQLDNSDETNINFIAVKIGDVSGNAIPNSLTVAASRNTNDLLKLYTQERQVAVGEKVSVQLQAEDLSSIEGYQFALAFPHLDLVEMEEGMLQQQHIGWQIRDQHVLPVSWNKTNELVTDQSLINLTFVAAKSGLLSELLTIQEELLEAEAYSNTQEFLGIELVFDKANQTFELLQNRPNPFSESTTIGFHIPTDDNVTLSILSMDGKVVKEWTQPFTKGFNEWTIHSKDFNLSGILHYQLTTSNQVATKKMIVLE